MHMKKFTAVILAAFLLAISTACTDGTKSTPDVRKTLTITYDSTLYGSGWMDSLAKSFAKSHPDISLKINVDDQLTTHYTALIQSGKKTPDLLFLRSTDWQQDAAAGRLANLDALYSTNIGEKSIRQKLRAGVAASFMISGHAFAYPWGAEAGGLLYNAGLFEKNGWKVPQTVSELSALCEQIQGSGISPFVWSADHAADWTDIVTGWWAQYEGQASMQNYLAMQSPAVYGQTGRLQALLSFEKLLPANSYGMPLSMTESTAVKAFTSGQAAMIPAGYLSVFVKNAPSSDLDLRAMQLPAPDGAKDTSLLAASIPGIAVIPAKAASPAPARAFLADLSSDTGIASFIAATGHPTPFLMDEKQTQSLPRFLKSAASLWEHNTVYMVSENKAYYTLLFDWPAQGSPILQIFTGARTAKQAFDENTQAAQLEWNTAAQ